MRILAIISGEYGLRHVSNIQAHKPEGWSIETWKAPAAFPLIGKASSFAEFTEIYIRFMRVVKSFH